MNAEPTGITRHHSVCPLDCPDRCTLNVEVDAGRVTRISGNHSNPLTAGFICNKVSRFTERVYGPDRLLHPMKRRGAKGSGDFVRVAWDEALADINEQLVGIVRNRGGEAILPFFYGGSNGMLTQGVLDERYFRLLGASRLARTVCAAPTGAAAKGLYGKMPSSDFRDFERSKLIIIWGANPAASNIHLLPCLKRARKNGARVILIDPRRTLSAKDIDGHLAIYPGTDLAVALALIAEIERMGRLDRAFLAEHSHGAERLLERAREFPLERAASMARIPASAIASLAKEYAEADPAMIRCGWGLERNRNGESSVAAVLALPTIAGKFGKPGGGYALSASGGYQVAEEAIAAIPAPPTRTVNMNLLGRTLLGENGGAVDALFVYNCNPVVTVPDQNRIERGLLRDDLFTVVHDQVMTDTACFADYVLPATTFLEHRELTKSYGNYGIALAEPVIPPVGESLSNEDLFRRLGRLAANSLHRGAEWFEEDSDALAERALAAIRGPVSRPVDLSALAGKPWHELDFPGPRPVQFVNCFPLTADRRIDLFPASFGDGIYRDEPLTENSQFPLALISPSKGNTISSTCGEYNLPEARLEISPDDAASRGIEEGGLVRIWNETGEVVCRASLSAEIRPGVVAIPKGLWRKASRNGKVASALVPDRVSRISGGACFNDARVEVERAPARSAIAGR